MLSVSFSSMPWLHSMIISAAAALSSNNSRHQLIVIMTFLTKFTTSWKFMNSYWWNYFNVCINCQKFEVLNTVLVEFHASEVSMETLYNKYQKIGYWNISVYYMWIYDTFKLFSWWAICDSWSSWKYVLLMNWKFTLCFQNI
jgi:hypothetical protein